MIGQFRAKETSATDPEMARVGGVGAWLLTWLRGERGPPTGVSTREVSEAQPVRVREVSNIGCGVGMSTRQDSRSVATSPSGSPIQRSMFSKLRPVANPAASAGTRTWQSRLRCGTFKYLAVFATGSLLLIDLGVSLAVVRLRQERRAAKGRRVPMAVPSAYSGVELPHRGLAASAGAGRGGPRHRRADQRIGAGIRGAVEDCPHAAVSVRAPRSNRTSRVRPCAM